MDHEKLPYEQEPDQVSGSDIPNDGGGVDAGDMYRMGKEQQFRVSSCYQGDGFIAKINAT
jgi:hypothetical protein